MSSRSSGDAQVMNLKARAESLCKKDDLDGDKMVDVQQTVRDTEQQWRTVLEVAEDTQRWQKMFVAKNVRNAGEVKEGG